MPNKALIVTANTVGLKYPDKDAVLMQESLTKCGYFCNHIEKPALSIMMPALADLTDDCGEADTIIFYFSGHGYILKGELFLILDDSGLEKNSGRFGINTIISSIKQSDAKNKLIILDCCHAGQIASKWSIDPVDSYRILTASSVLGESRAKEFNTLQSSFMTYKLHEALTLRPPVILEGESVSLNKLYDWLLNEVELHNSNNPSNIVPRPDLLGSQKDFHISNTPIEDNAIEEIETFKNQISSQLNHCLLSSRPDSCAPKELSSIFVEPPLSKKPKAKLDLKRKQASNDYYQLEDILKNHGYYFILGTQESGKTTLLNYISLRILNKGSQNRTLPFYIDCEKIPPGKVIDSIKTAMLQLYGPSFYTKLESNKFLDRGNCVLLFDNLNVQNQNILKKIKSFIKEYPKNTYFFVPLNGADFIIDAHIQRIIKVFGLPKSEKIYIQPFDRQRIRKLVENWLSSSHLQEDVDKIYERVVKLITSMYLPKSPVMLSLLLSIFEKQDTYIPTNKAFLVEKFIELSMEPTFRTSISVFSN